MIDAEDRDQALRVAIGSGRSKEIRQAEHDTGGSDGERERDDSDRGRAAILTRSRA
jgi:hypothetical protein